MIQTQTSDEQDPSTSSTVEKLMLLHAKAADEEAKAFRNLSEKKTQLTWMQTRSRTFRRYMRTAVMVLVLSVLAIIGGAVSSSPLLVFLGPHLDTVLFVVGGVCGFVSAFTMFALADVGLKSNGPEHSLLTARSDHDVAEHEYNAMQAIKQTTEYQVYAHRPIADAA